MKRRCLLPICLALACRADDPGFPADCARDEPVQLVQGRFERHLEVQRTRDTTYLALADEDGRYTTHAGPACGADPVLLADGARLLPTRIALDPRDDDPTLACDLDTSQHFRVDLAGERAPQLLFPYLRCHGRPTRYGALFIGGWGYLRLFGDFPDEATATPLREEGGNDVLVLDEWIVYTGSSDLHAYRLSTGETFAIPGHVLGLLGSGDHILWYDYEDIATVTLVDLRTNTPTVLGEFDRDAVWNSDHFIPDFSSSSWDFDPSGRYVYHIPPDGPPEAFDLAGRPVDLPAPGEIVRLLDAGVVSVAGDDGQVYITRPHDAAPTALDAHLADDEQSNTLRPVGDHLERVVDGELLRIDLDGSPSRILASGVGSRGNAWLTEEVLLTLHEDGDLERIDTATGERERLSTDAIAWKQADEALYVLRSGAADPAEDGVWYLSAAALGVPADEAP